jgi:RsiW-degrading membrane proteinase PrsW (M82 family)
MPFLMDNFETTATVRVHDQHPFLSFSLSPALWLTAVYLYGLGFHLTDRLCGKRKAWWSLLGAALVTAIAFVSPVGSLFDFLFTVALPGKLPEPKDWGPIPFHILLYRLFFAAGLREELMKAVPVFLALGLGKWMKPALRDNAGVVEPLDGIILGAASAAMFAFLETMLQYLPQHLEEVKQFAILTSHVYHYDSSAGFDILFVRSIAQASGHIAYSGYFGYYIGLSVLKPSKRWLLLGSGYVLAALIHTLWDASQTQEMGWQVLIGLLSYGFLAAAILKARELSPNRRWLQPSLLGGNLPNAAPPVDTGGALEAPGGQAASMPQPRAAAPPVPSTANVQDGLLLLLGNQRLSLSAGARFSNDQIPGLDAEAGDGVVAEVDQHPHDPRLLGLKNLSNTVWTAMDPAQSLREIPVGRSFALVRGTKIDFGSESGEIA